MTAQDVKRVLKKSADSVRAKGAARFFKTGKGQYGEGDIFWGISVPESRKVAKKYGDLPLNEIETLLAGPVHECRLTALFILVYQYEHTSDEQKKVIVDFYLSHTRYMNNWDLVDSSAYKILGDYLITRDRSVLHKLAESKDLWEQRIAIVSTYAFIRQNQLEDTFSLAEILLQHPHDLMHKAVGWMLREAGKRDEKQLRKFLDDHAMIMPRTMLRYSIEKFDEKVRQMYLSKKIIK